MRGRLQRAYKLYKAGALSLDDMILESRAFAVSVGRLEGREDAEDLAQEACIRVWTCIDSFDGVRASYPTWLRKILRNLIRDKLRHMRSVLAGVRIVETPKQELATDDSGDAPARSIEKLPLDCHELYIVRALIDGASMREIAEATELSLKALRSRFDRIRDRCRG